MPRRLRPDPSLVTALPLDVPERRRRPKSEAGVSAEAGFSALLAATASVKAALGDAESDPWVHSPFAFIRTLPSARRGKVGEQMVEDLLSGAGYPVLPREDPSHDRVVGGYRVEVKLSTLWASGVYTFQQLRDQNYQYLVLLGLSPNSAHAWLVAKDVALSATTPQHGGAAGTDTRWASVDPSDPPGWLAGYGGDLGSFFTVCADVFGPPGASYGPARLDRSAVTTRRGWETSQIVAGRPGLGVRLFGHHGCLVAEDGRHLGGNGEVPGMSCPWDDDRQHDAGLAERGRHMRTDDTFEFARQGAGGDLELVEDADGDVAHHGGGVDVQAVVDLVEQRCGHRCAPDEVAGVGLGDARDGLHRFSEGLVDGGVELADVVDVADLGHCSVRIHG
jgi:hypothetical protein